MLPGGGHVTTTASARFLVIGRARGAAPEVIATTDDLDRALRQRATLVRQYPHTRWFVMDQRPTTERNTP